MVIFGVGTKMDTGTLRYDFDAAGWKVTGPGISTVEDSADQAVRALAMAHKRATGA